MSLFVPLYQDTAAGHCAMNNTVYNVKLLLLSQHLMLRNSLLLAPGQQKKLNTLMDFHIFHEFSTTLKPSVYI